MEFHTGISQLRKQLKTSAEYGVYMAQSAVKEKIESEELGEIFSKLVQEVEELDAEAVKLEGTFTSLVETYKQPDLEIPNEAAYKKAYNKAAKGHKKDGAHPYYKEARKIIAELTNNLEEADDTADLQVEQVQHSRKDPISKKDIVNPVINTACGHVYDRDSIIQFAGTKRSIKCVMQGCSQNITIKNLSDYPEFWTNIKQQE